MTDGESRSGQPHPDILAPPEAPGGHGVLWFVLGLCVAGAVAFGLHRYLPQSGRGDAARAGEAFAAGGPASGSADPSGAEGQRAGQPSEKGQSKSKAGGPPAGKAAGMQGPRSVPVVVAKARRGDLPLYLDAPATVIALNTVTVRTRVDGPIVKVNFKEGQLINEGDVLVEIDPRPFEVALAQAEANFAKAKADAEQARAALGKDQAQAHNAHIELERDTDLIAKGMVSKEEFDNFKYQAAAFDATVKADEANIKSAEEAAHSAQTAIDSARLQLSFCHIVAPISGRIGLRLVDLGNIVHAADNTGLAVITQIEPITVTFSLREDDLPQVTKANDLDNKLPVEVRNRDRTAPLASGTLMAIDSQIDLVTLTIKFKAIFDNKDHALFPNQAVNVRLLVDTKKDTVLVPAAALQHAPSETGKPQVTFVYVVKPDSTVEMRPIKQGIIEGDDASVEEGLSDGEVVVTEGVDKLEAGMKVSTPGSGAPGTGAASKGHGARGGPEASPAEGSSGPAADPAHGTSGVGAESFRTNTEGAPKAGASGKRRDH